MVHSCMHARVWGKLNITGSGVLSLVDEKQWLHGSWSRKGLGYHAVIKEFVPKKYLMT